jgi:hypothetical protein
LFDLDWQNLVSSQVSNILFVPIELEDIHLLYTFPFSSIMFPPRLSLASIL